MDCLMKNQDLDLASDWVVICNGTHDNRELYGAKLHQVLHQPTPDRPWLPQTQQNWQLIQMDGNDQPPREISFLKILLEHIQNPEWGGQSCLNFCP